ncbi:hypothetical protein BV394_03640 [Brevirhabdus pacifica]|uniref:Uncharacterized protein n=1 Tax=Brevirhabdus pacifica TaxID=1267768 RepID=A0A1U7DG30_9RHOB|nr:NUDIX hydrolase [Brevirhabdus pacifica]APX88932.1 hypothetical protein BV394_03640 [Brevirhabdus pacifica]OWU80159.1 hypothetical protein ATO5_04325 [Loktanella sp. 22II-4b]PJJ86517.1 ADP-ribose pyrophosphatase YjhB (NUDIX family) [Brevirhabdus pacifica]
MIEYENPWFRVIREGRQHWVEEPDARNGAAVIAMRGDRLILLEMHRPAQGGARTLEIPRGYGAEGETARQAARRELCEETGYDAPLASFQPLGFVRPNTAMLSSRVAVFAVTLAPDARPGPRDAEAGAVTDHATADLDALIRAGGIEDGFTLSALCLARAGGVLR